MAWIKAMGASESKKYIYKDGVWSYAYANPGSFQWGSNACVGFTLDADKMYTSQMSNYQIIGTSGQIDVSGYSALHIKAKGLVLSGVNCGKFGISNSTQLTNGTNADITTVGSIVDYTIDISNYASGYIFALSSGSAAMEVYEIYLE